MAYIVNLDHIVKTLSGQSIYTDKEVRKFLDIFINEIKEYLKDGDTIELRGLGTFSKKKHKGRHVELKTKIIDSKNHFVTLFKESKVLKRLVNE